MRKMLRVIHTGCGMVVAWTIPACGFNVARASLAAVTSFVNLAITRQAASCWYKA